MDAMWYYTQGNSGQLGPVTEAEIRALLEQGKIKPTDLVWTDGMGEWAAARTRPEFSAPSGPDSASAVQDTGLPPKLLGWMSFTGAMTLLAGVIYCLSCFGLVFGVFMIVAGVALLGCRTTLESAGTPPPAFVPFFGKLNTVMAMLGVAYIVCLVITAITVIFYVVAIAGGVRHMFGG